MLRITVPTNTGPMLSFSDFENYELPAPPNGVDAEINNDAILKFEDEEEAITYADELMAMADEINDKNTPQYSAINDIIVAIKNDEFVRSFTQ